MAGLYIHIPFCKSRCIYCGFYSTTRLQMRQRYVDAVCREMELTAQRWLSSPCCTPISTVYIGGGTPSQLTFEQLQQFFIYINKVYGTTVFPPLNDNLSTKGTSTVGDSAAKEPSESRKPADVEVTIEVNPDDVTEAYASMLARLPVNRVSMGVQTFNDQRLQFLRRRHTAAQITTAVDHLRQAGINNISIDLMYGFPGETIGDWHRDIDRALALGVEHLSAYSLQYEEGTQLTNLLNSHSIMPIGEEVERRMYYDLIDHLTAAGYEHYEISNFALPHRRSRHNSNYWNHTPYIGLGVAAHSFDGNKRRWNVSDIERYIEGIENGRPFIDEETISGIMRYNDLVMISLRTIDGLNLSMLPSEQQSYCLAQSKRYIDSGLLVYDGRSHRLRLTRNGLFVSDMVIVDLFMV